MLDVLGLILLSVQDRVRGLVQGRLGCLGGKQVRVDDDASGLGVGVAVGSSRDGLALDGPAGAGEVVGGGLEDAAGVVSGERSRDVGRVAGFLVDEVGLSHVEHGDGEEPHAALFFFLAGSFVLDRLANLAAAKDADTALALAHLAVELLPGPVSGDVGRLGPLGEDQQQVSQAVAVERLGEVQEGRPCLGFAQRLDLCRDRRLQLLGLGTTLLGALGAGDLAGHLATSGDGISTIRATQTPSTFSCREGTKCHSGQRRECNPQGGGGESFRPM